MHLFTGLRLRDKGMILVISLLFLELFFIGILGYLLTETENELTENLKAKKVLEGISKAQQSLTQVGISLAEYAATHNEIFSKQFDEEVARAHREVDNLEKLMNRPAERASFQSIKKTTEDSTQLLQTARKMVDEKSSQYTVTAMLSQTRGQLSRFTRAMKAASSEYRYAEVMPAQEGVSSSYGQLKIVLILGLALNIIFAVVLMWSFLGTITRRLEVLVENTILFSKQSPLKEPLSGNDELARLDQSFHTMAKSIEDAEKIKRQLASMLTHDLRSPLSSIQWTLALLSAGAYGELSEDGVDRVSSAEKGCDDLISLINDLLDLDKVKTGKLSISKENLDLSDTVDDSLSELKGLADRMNIKLQKTVDGTFKYRGDGKRLRQLVVNLVANAIKFSPSGSTVDVDIQAQDDAFELRVVDAGRGIAKEDQERLFERYETGSGNGEHPDIKSSGLGLAIAKAIVESHGGTIGVISEEGIGSTFWVRLPHLDN